MDTKLYVFILKIIKVREQLKKEVTFSYNCLTSPPSPISRETKKKMTATAVYGRAESRNLQRNMSIVQRPVCFVNVQLSLHENVVFSVCALMDNAAYIIFIMWNSISGLESWNHFRFNISCGLAVTVRSHQKRYIR